MSASRILVFDSGLGGLTVLREIAAARPDAAVVYAADDAGFPYGRWDETALVARVATVMRDLIERHSPHLVVIACNTASVQALAALRERFTIPFVGTVPAIKPACASSRSKRVSVLGTQATVAREYTQGLIRDFANGCSVTLVGAAHLAEHAEAYLRGEPVANEAIRAEIAPCFVESDGARTDTVVLACTHYPLLLERLQALAPWPVDFVDPAPAIARRVVDLIGRADSATPAHAPQFVFTSGRAPSEPLRTALDKFARVAVPAAGG